MQNSIKFLLTSTLAASARKKIPPKVFEFLFGAPTDENQWSPINKGTYVGSKLPILGVYISTIRIPYSKRGITIPNTRSFLFTLAHINKSHPRFCTKKIQHHSYPPRFKTFIIPSLFSFHDIKYHQGVISFWSCAKCVFLPNKVSHVSPLSRFFHHFHPFSIFKGVNSTFLFSKNNPPVGTVLALVGDVTDTGNHVVD